MKHVKGIQQQNPPSVDPLTDLLTKLFEDEEQIIGCSILPMLILIILAVVGIFSTWKDPSNWPIVVFPLIMVAGWGMIIFAPLFPRDMLVRTVGLILILSLGSVAVYSDSSPDFPARVVHFISEMVRKLGIAAVPTATALFATVGYGLYILKQKHLLIYSYLEIGFAFVSANVAVARARDKLDLAGLTIVITSVYFFIRGLDNRRTARLQRRGD